MVKPALPPPPILVSQAPVVLPTEPVVASLPPQPPSPVVAVVAEEARPAPLPVPKPAGPLTLNADLVVACPEHVAPAYPSLSLRLGETGKVVLRVELDEEGRIDMARIQVSSGHARLDNASLAAIRSWRCNPARRDGVAVRAVAMQPFNFILEGQ